METIGAFTFVVYLTFINTPLKIHPTDVDRTDKPTKPHWKKKLIKMSKLDFVYTAYIFVNLLTLLRQCALLLYC